ncbi:MAG: hypothetical protein JKX73_01105 [Flavobacteriales bacterium]|nr:hypothetical protein [Flavobacteriales bacterium]
MIFKDKRKEGSLIPSKGSEGLRQKHLRIIWATWHLASVFGWCLGAILIKVSIAQSGLNVSFIEFIIHSMIGTMLITSLLVLVATKGKHPGWVVSLVIAILLWMG